MWGDSAERRGQPRRHGIGRPCKQVSLCAWGHQRGVLISASLSSSFLLIDRLPTLACSSPQKAERASFPHSWRPLARPGSPRYPPPCHPPAHSLTSQRSYATKLSPMRSQPQQTPSNTTLTTTRATTNPYSKTPSTQTMNSTNSNTSASNSTPKPPASK